MKPDIQTDNAIGLGNRSRSMGIPWSLEQWSDGGVGAVFVYTFDGQSWGNKTKISPFGLPPGGAFGHIVDLENRFVSGLPMIPQMAAAPAQCIRLSSMVPGFPEPTIYAEGDSWRSVRFW